MLKLLKYLKPFWWQVIILVLSIGVQSWASLQLPALMARIVNDGIVTNNLDIVWSTGFTMLGYAFLTGIMALVAGFFAARIGTGFSRNLRADIFRKVLTFNIAEINNFSTASLITRTTNDVNQIQQTVVMALSMLVRAPILCIGAIILAIATAPNMAWIIALAIAVTLFFIFLILGIAAPKFKLFQSLLDKITLLTRENLTGLRVIRAFNNQHLEEQKFDRTNNELTRVILFINRVMSFETPLVMLVFNGITLLCIWIGVSLISTDIAYLGNMMAFMQYAIQVIMAFLVMSALLFILPRANVSANRINKVLRAEPHIKWRKTTKGTPSETPSVEFKNVSFAYEDADEKVLENISFKAKAGETTAFIGSTGSGKSTLINLVPRFHEISSGEILINGLNQKNYAMDDLMPRIGYVPQKGVLFSGTVKSNIAFGAPNINDEKIKEAAKISQSYEFIEKFPEKFNHHISQGGTNVSGGQRQRLSIARAIAKTPDIYIFDDSFSALDMKTDKKLRTALKPATKNAVTLVVAQRISTIKDAEQIIVLSEGKIVGKGTHYKLLKSCAVYREITKSQLSDNEFTAELKIANRPGKGGVKHA